MKSVPFLTKVRPYFFFIGIFMMLVGFFVSVIGRAIADTGGSGETIGFLLRAVAVGWFFGGVIFVVAAIYFRFFDKPSELSSEDLSDLISQEVTESTVADSSNIKNLPAVIDAQPIINRVISIERGSGFNFGGLLRSLLIAVGFLIGNLMAIIIGGIIELVSGIDGIAFAVTLVTFVVMAYFIWLVGRQLFPNVEEAKRTLTTGVIPLDEILEGLNAREPGNAEKELLASALSTFGALPEIEFDAWYVVPSSLAITYAFGRILIISREALDSDDLPYIIAHELGHLNNGDGFVRSAIWSLGKGFFGTENITLFGSVADADEDEYNIDELSNLGRSLSQKDWTGSLVQAVSVALTSGGKGVKKLRRPIRKYFKKWDIEADKFALKYVDPDEYLRYIGELELFERGTGEGPFNAPAIHRFDAVEAVIGG